MTTAVRMPSQRLPLVGAALALSALALLLIHNRNAAVTVHSSAPLIEFDAEALSETAQRDADIAFYAQRAREDGAGATDRLTLARLHFARARSSGSQSDYAQAESLARESVSAREQRNGQAFEVLASALMARHAFREAHTIALQVDSLDPGVPSHLALLGEIELELGDYDAAARHFKAVHYDGRQFTIGARIARWYEVTGRSVEAREILRRALVEVDRRDDLPREQIAWFHYRLGELELRTGRLASADSAFQTALQRNPEDVRVLGGLARTALARNDWRRAIEYGENAINIQLDPATLGTIAQAYAALGDSAQATQYGKAMSLSALTQPGQIHRAWGLFLLDHGSAADRADVLRRARRELRERKDVYGYDLLAWALHRAGRSTEARAAMRLALSQRTEDVLLASHARAILEEGAAQ
jgi:tetratricopeptide (TPR) repeat protein